jgi:hypothetical protein
MSELGHQETSLVAVNTVLDPDSRLTRRWTNHAKTRTGLRGVPLARPHGLRGNDVRFVFFGCWPPQLFKQNSMSGWEYQNWPR